MRLTSSIWRRASSIASNTCHESITHLEFDDAQQRARVHRDHAEDALEQQQHRDGAEVEGAQRELVQQHHARGRCAVRNARQHRRWQPTHPPVWAAAGRACLDVC